MGASPDEILAMVVFVRVVQARSFTGAAAMLGVSKSVVSARVAALEAQLGVRLLHRTTRKLSLTQEGQALYEQCARVVAAADEASAAASGAGDEPRGVLRVDAPVAFTQEYLTAPIAAYLARHPGVRVELSMNDRFVELADQGIDVAIRIASRLEGPRVVVRKLATDHTVLVGAPAYLARRGTPEAPDDLARHDCLVYALLKVSQEWRFRARGSREVFTPPIEARFSAGSGAVLRQAALGGMGLAVLPTFMVARDVAEGRLRVLVDAFVATKLGIYAAYPESPRVPGKTRAFVELLATHFRTPRW